MAHYVEKQVPVNNMRKILGYLQAITSIFAFLNILYWLLIISGIKLSFLDWLFLPLWDFVGLFYTYKPEIAGETIDFRGIVSAICLFFLSGMIKSFAQMGVKEQENVLAGYGNSARNAFATKQSANTISTVAAKIDTNNFVFLLDVKLTSISNFIQDSKLSMEEIDNIKTKFYETLLNNMNNNYILQKGFFKKKLYIVYKGFDNIDNFIFYTKETLNSLSREFTKPTLKIDFLVGLGFLSDLEELKKEVNILDTILCLNINNEFLTTVAFKTNYDDKPKQQYRLNTKGIYNLSKNLNVTNNQEVYTIRENADYS